MVTRKKRALPEKTTLRILHILDHSLPVQSGYAFRSQAIAIAQKQRGWEPIVVTSPKHYESDDSPWTAVEWVGNLEYFRSRPISVEKRSFEAELRVMYTLTKRLISLCRREHPVIIHAHSPVLNAIPSLLVGWHLRIPVVYEMRALWEDAAVDHGTYGHQSMKYRMVKSLETWVCQRADHVAVLCEGLRKDLLQRGIPTEKMTVIPNGVDGCAFRAMNSDQKLIDDWHLSGKKVIGFIGSFFHYEGLEILIDAIARLSKIRTDIVLLLVGGGPAETTLRAKVREFNLGQFVIIPGAVPQDEVPAVYSLIDVLAYPRNSMRLTELVTPLKPLEAMAMGKALVASDVGGHRELIRHEQTGLLFPAGNSVALAKSIARLLDDVNLRRSLETQAVQWVRKERSWVKTTEGYADIYAKLWNAPGCHGHNRGLIS
jgi:PEP-CTERM/exosortase A-associated glycosyltransferase